MKPPCRVGHHHAPDGARRLAASGRGRAQTITQRSWRWIAALAFAVGCAEPASGVRNCAPGATRACACDAGLQGTETCNAAGTRFEGCSDCRDPPCTTPDAGPTCAPGGRSVCFCLVTRAGALVGCQLGERSCVDGRLWGACVCDAPTDAGATDAAPPLAPPYARCAVSAQCAAGAECYSAWSGSATANICRPRCRTEVDCPPPPGGAEAGVLCIDGRCGLLCGALDGGPRRSCPHGGACSPLAPGGDPFYCQ